VTVRFFRAGDLAGTVPEDGLDWDIETLEDLIRVPNFHDWMDLRVVDVDPGQATILLPYREELIGNPQIPSIHGGILAGLIDLAGGAATFTLTNAPTPTIDLRIDYVRPALERDTVADAEIVNAGSTIAFVDVDVVQIADEADVGGAEDVDEAVLEEHGKLVATGRATYSTKNAKPEAGPDDIPIG
jgi:uncharacterized protein (TIGR00369 family)